MLAEAERLGEELKKLRLKKVTLRNLDESTLNKAAGGECTTARRKLMSAASHGAACGVVLGIVVVIFLQQIAYFDLSDLVPSIEYLVIGGVVGGVLGALIGWILGRSYLARHATGSTTVAK